MDAIIVHWRVPAAQEAGTVWGTAGGNSGETAAATLCAEIATNSAAEQAVDQVLVLVPATTLLLVPAWHLPPTPAASTKMILTPDHFHDKVI